MPRFQVFAAMVRLLVEVTLQYAIDISQSAIKCKRNRKNIFEARIFIGFWRRRACRVSAREGARRMDRCPIL
jgi:hypothetical protein